MNKNFLALTALLAVSSFGISTAQAGVGVSVSIGQPGFYGQIDVGDYYPRPQVLYTQPTIVQTVPVYQQPAPIYLRVPPNYTRNWPRYCGQYNACGRPVYFVQDTWYQNVYAPRYRAYREHGDDGRRYDRGYWSKHGGRHMQDNQGNGRGRDDRGGNDRGHDRH